MLNTRNEETNTGFYAYLACLVNTVTLNMYLSMSYTGLTRRNTVFVFVWLSQEYVNTPIQHVGHSTYIFVVAGKPQGRQARQGRQGREPQACQGHRQEGGEGELGSYYACIVNCIIANNTVYVSCNRLNIVSLSSMCYDDTKITSSRRVNTQGHPASRTPTPTAVTV